MTPPGRSSIGAHPVVRGSVWWVSLPEPEGSEPGYRRPALVVQSNEFTRSNIGTVIVALLTSNLRLGEAPGNVRVRATESGLPRDSVVNVSQLYTVDKTMLVERCGVVGDTTRQALDRGLRLVLGV